MDHQEPYRTRSFSRESSLASSLSLSRSLPLFVNNDVDDSESVSEAGDIGDRSLRRRHSSGRSNRLFSSEDLIEQGGDDTSRQEQGSVIKPLPEHMTTSPLPTKSLLSPETNNPGKKEEPVLPKSLEYISCLIHLAVFGILGAITRYLLQKLFGPSVARVTSDGSILYLDLPSNMVGSFLMGWFGVVFKADITRVSEFLAIGLSTGYLGSLTTFSGWNQKMLDLSADGKWLYAVLGFLLGLFLASYSIILGVETAKGFRWLLDRRASSSSKERTSCLLEVNTFKMHLVSMTLMVVLLVALLAVSATQLVKEFDKGTSEAQLWLGCLVAAPGVWLRWFLARLNGRGLGKDGQYLRWVPFGTVIANAAAASAMAALATTVSTFMAEFNAMRESDYPWRAYAYASFTIAVSFAMGTVIYSVPVWVVGFN
uniref:Fluoride ion transporter CrcB n=1 Tax=Brassica campestris TaxID=3711 RepID=M4DK91_BRACM